MCLSVCLCGSTYDCVGLSAYLVGVCLRVSVSDLSDCACFELVWWRARRSVSGSLVVCFRICALLFFVCVYVCFRVCT